MVLPLSDTAGKVLVSQEVRQKIVDGQIVFPGSKKRHHTDGNTPGERRGWFKDPTLEAKIQPQSYQPSIGDYLFAFTDQAGVFMPDENRSVLDAVAEINCHDRHELEIPRDGFELKVGCNYLIPCVDKVVKSPKDIIIFSPRSRYGRLFLEDRLATDFNPNFDEIGCLAKDGVELGLYAYVRPKVFNIRIYPGTQLGALWFFDSFADPLPTPKLRKICQNTPFLFSKDNPEHAVEHEINNGLVLHADAVGSSSNDLIGRKAKRNHTPIDTARPGEHPVHDYFEDTTKGQRFVPGQHYLYTSKEYLKIPPGFCAQLRLYSHNLRGQAHDAGFFEELFEGNGVHEGIFYEEYPFTLKDGVAISKLDVYQITQRPDKNYGKNAGSSHQRQLGPNPGAFFEKTAH